MDSGVEPRRQAPQPRVVYNAFLSYSHSADAKLASALQRALHRFAKRPFRLRAVRVFRDTASLAANPALWPAIEQALAASEYLILMASPQAAASAWVQKEIHYWRENMPARNILIALTGGEIAWDGAARDFDWSKTTALPSGLSGAFEAEPLWVDLRWAQGAEISVTHPDFRNCVADLAAPLHGRAKDELVGEDLRQARRIRRVTFATIVLLATLAVALGWLSIEVERRRQIAAQERDRALTSQSRYLADATLRQVEEENPDIGVLLALEALPKPQEDRPYVAEAEAALHRALGALAATKIADVAERSLQVNSVAFSPDGKRFVTVASEDTARIWDAATGKEITVLKGHEQPVWSAVYLPDGSRIVTVSADGTARLWDAFTGEQVRVFRGHRGPVVHVAISSDGRLLATASADATAKVWQIESGTEISTLRGHAQAVCCIQMNSDGTRIVTASVDGTARLWDVQSGKTLAVFKDTPQALSAVAGHAAVIRFSPDGRLLATAHEDSTIRLWQASDGSPIATLKAGSAAIDDGEFSNDSRFFAATSGDGTIRLWLLRWQGASLEPVSAAGVLHQRQDAQGSIEVNGVVFSPADNFVATAGEDFLQMWDPVTGSEVAALSLEAPASSIVMSRDAEHFAVIHLDHVSLWKINSSSFIRWRHQLGHERIEAADRGPIVVLSAAGPHFTWTDELGWKPPVAVANDAKTAAAATGRNVVLINGGTGRVIASIAAHSRVVSRAIFSAAGDRLLTTSYDGSAKIWDARNGALVATLSGHEKPVMDGAFSPSGGFVATVSEDRTLRFWDTTGTAKFVLRGHDAAIRRLAFSKDGRRVITISDDRTARVWDVASHMELSTLHAEKDGFAVASLDASGDRAVTSGNAKDYTVRLWDTATGKELHRWQDSNGTVIGLAFAMDGQTVLAWGADGAARLWEAQGRYNRLAEVGFGCAGPGSIAQAWLSDDRKRIVTVLRNGRTDVWDSGSGAILLTLHTFVDTRMDGSPCEFSLSESPPELASVAASPDLHNLLLQAQDGSAVLFTIPSLEEAVRRARQLIPRPLTADERRKFFLTQ